MFKFCIRLGIELGLDVSSCNCCNVELVIYVVYGVFWLVMDHLWVIFGGFSICGVLDLMFGICDVRINYPIFLAYLSFLLRVWD